MDEQIFKKPQASNLFDNGLRITQSLGRKSLQKTTLKGWTVEQVGQLCPVNNN